MIESISAEDDRSLAPPAGHAGQQAVVKSATFVEVATKLPAVGNVATNVPQLSWPGLARPPTSCGASRAKDVGGRPEPVLGRAFGPTRGPAMTRGIVLPTSRYFSANAAFAGACFARHADET